RVMANTSAIRKLYVDDLSTASSERSRGHGATLLRALVQRARELGCYRIELHSGVQRHAAHRFYLREGMDIGAHPFSMELDCLAKSEVPGGPGRSRTDDLRGVSAAL